MWEETAESDNFTVNEDEGGETVYGGTEEGESVVERGGDGAMQSTVLGGETDDFNDSISERGNGVSDSQMVAAADVIEDLYNRYPTVRRQELELILLAENCEKVSLSKTIIIISITKI